MRSITLNVTWTFKETLSSGSLNIPVSLHETAANSSAEPKGAMNSKFLKLRCTSVENVF